MEWSKEDWQEKSTCESCYKTAIDCCNSLLSLEDEERGRYVVIALALTIYRMLEAIGVITKINGQERLEVHDDAR